MQSCPRHAVGIYLQLVRGEFIERALLCGPLPETAHDTARLDVRAGKLLRQIGGAGGLSDAATATKNNCVTHRKALATDAPHFEPRRSELRPSRQRRVQQAVRENKVSAPYC